ncbi:prepilin-type N-terminal cleavage/methylation domain-containing protein [Rhodoferax saidenbachensis]|uniref:MSHA pilin protein MshA n=1 Tax=Rhodoferax saidenbachensis TaxID=1484693 RepID=A0ABU1ZJB6_9BURK|nr:prepilin-type N-terminal cleavage/methylation domain-containing protein [Rhodoferax saidenbachensis]MDR7305639.1 MSHA pilin protein MshA [Rhodoferax saidenbachensis]
MASNKLLLMQILSHDSQLIGISRNQRGFTLIELVMIIVILGVLAAVTIPKFVDLSLDAQVATTQGVAGGISSASAINYAARAANSGKGVAITQCEDAGSLLQGGLPGNYSMGPPGFPTAIGANVTTGCTVSGPKNTSATAYITGIP